MYELVREEVLNVMPTAVNINTMPCYSEDTIKYIPSSLKTLLKQILGQISPYALLGLPKSSNASSTAIIS